MDLKHLNRQTKVNMKLHEKMLTELSPNLFGVGVALDIHIRGGDQYCKSVGKRIRCTVV